MLRLIIDKIGSGHCDMFLKIDSLPERIQIADSYYLFDFLEISDEDFNKLKLKDNEVLKTGAIELIKYWKERIKSIDKGQKKFIPFDLSDQYIGGLMLEKTKLGFKTKLVWTDTIYGNSVGKSNLEEQIKNNKTVFNDRMEIEWLISEEGIFNGLDWSITELTK